MNRRLVLILLISITLTASAQNFMRPNEWQKYRRELFITLGSANFLGDLGGRDRKGTDFSPVDLNFSQTRTAFGVGGRYRLSKAFNVVGKFSFLNVKGDDAITRDKYRNNRNLNFKSNIYELSGRGEVGYQSRRRGASRYGIRQNFGQVRNITHNIYAFLGVGVFYFNPKGRTPEGKFVNLYPLHTEGQGLPGGPRQYKRVSVSIPAGVYYKMIVNKVWTIGVEFSFRKTFTDYIDDVGGTYYNPAALEAAYGPLAKQMGDPNLGLIPGATSPDGYGYPAQRGDGEKDAFMTLEVTASYIFKKQRKSARLRSKF
jgi:hypothetical protein